MDAVRGMRTSLNQHQPVSVGGIEGKEQAQRFFQWAKKTLPEDDYQRIKALHATYWRTAAKAGLVPSM